MKSSSTSSFLYTLAVSMFLKSTLAVSLLSSGLQMLTMDDWWVKNFSGF